MTLTRTFQIALTILTLVVIASVTYAFAAANAGPQTTAGDGVNAVSGYTITNVTYALNATDPSKLDAVFFTLNASAITVRAKLNETSLVWYACNNPSGNDWECATNGASTAAADQLRVAASNH